MGNQQERLDYDLLWFGGVFDGEGSINLVFSHRTGQICPSISFTNTSSVLISEARRIFDREGIAYHVGKPRTTIGLKPYVALSINGAKRAQRFLTMIEPYLRGKRDEAQCVLRWIESRFSRPRGAPYDRDEFAAFLWLREMHGSRGRESSETTRQTLIRLGRYSPTSAREPERATEMMASAA